MSDIDIAKIRRLDGGLLVVFRELLLRRRATEAAHALGLSSSAVSHALARLRSLFGDPLFIRRPHGLEPTRRALELAPQIETLLELTDKTLRKDEGFDPKATRRVFRIAAPDFFIALVGARLVEQLRSEAPSASLRLDNLGLEASFELLRRGEMDLAVGRFAASRPGFERELLYEDRYCVVARRDHPVFKKRMTREQYLSAGHVFSLSPGEGGEGSDVERARDLHYHIVVPRWLTVLNVVAASDAVGTVPRKLAERHADVLGLRIIEAPFVGDVLSVAMIRRTDRSDLGLDWCAGMIRKAAK